MKKILSFCLNCMCKLAIVKRYLSSPISNEEKYHREENTMKCTVKRFPRFIARPISFFCSLYNSNVKKSLIPLSRDLIFHHCKSIDLNFHSARFKNCQVKI